MITNAPKELTVKLPHRTDTWHLTDECMKIAEPIARRLRMSAEELLAGLSDGSLVTGSEPIDSESVPAGFEVKLPDDKRIRMRIARAAAIDQQSIEKLVWSALASDMECAEESRIFDADGSVIGDTLPLQEFRTFRMKDPAARRRWQKG